MKYIEENNLVSENDKIIIAISGGPDSVALFHILNGIKEIYNLTFVFAHINHMLRAEKSDNDEQFVIQMGEKYGVETKIKRVDLAQYSKKNKVGLEEAGREVRYSFFREVMSETESNKVATAHNADDNVETFLFRMMRGTSVDGLKGIPVKRDIYVRPLLNTSKAEIFHYLSVSKLLYRIDESNLESVYTRNKIRLELIPYIEKNFNPSFKEKILSLIEDINSLKANEKKSEIIIGNKIILKEYMEMTPFERKKCLNEYLNINSVENNRKIIEQIDKMVFSEGCKYICVSGNKIVYKGYNEIYISEKKMKKQNFERVVVGNKIVFNDKYIIGAEYTDVIINDPRYYYVDADKIDTDNIIARVRKDGDRFIPTGMKGSKKLKDYFCDIKIDRNIRDEIPIIENNETIIWICGIRGSEKVRVTKDTKKILKLTFEEVQNFE